MSKDNPRVANSRQDIRDRRERMLHLMAKGLNQKDISQALGVTRMTVHRDLTEINKDTEREYNNMIRESIPTMFDSCLRSMNELLKEAWAFYIRDDKTITHWHRLAAMRLINDVTDKKFNMISNGPALMEINKLKTKLEELKHGIQLTP